MGQPTTLTLCLLATPTMCGRISLNVLFSTLKKSRALNRTRRSTGFWLLWNVFCPVDNAMELLSRKWRPLMPLGLLVSLREGGLPKNHLACLFSFQATSVVQYDASSR